MAELSEPPGSARRGACVALRALACVPLLLAGCSKILGIEDLGGPAGGDPGDAATDSGGDSGGGGGHLTVRGTVYLGGPNQPIATKVELARPDGTVAATTTSDATGAFTLPLDFTGASVDVAVHAMGSQMNGVLTLDEYLVFGAPLTADRAQVKLALRSQSDLQALANSAATTYNPGSPFVEISVQNADGTTAAGATLVVDQIIQGVRYLTANGQPSPQLSATTTNGGIYVFNAKPGATTFSTSGTVASQPRVVQLMANTVAQLELHP